MWRYDGNPQYYLEIFFADSPSGNWHKDGNAPDRSFGGSTSLTVNLTGDPFQYYKYVKFSCYIKTTEYPNGGLSGAETTYVKLNSPPNPPILIIPPSGSLETYNRDKTFVRLQAGTDPDGTSQKYKIKIDTSQVSKELPYQGTADFITYLYDWAVTNDGVVDSTVLQYVIVDVDPPWGTLGARVAAE